MGSIDQRGRIKVRNRRQFKVMGVLEAGDAWRPGGVDGGPYDFLDDDDSRASRLGS